MAVAERSAQTPLYEEVVHDRVFGAGLIAFNLFLVIVIGWAMMNEVRKHPHEHYSISSLMFSMLFIFFMTLLCYYTVYPLQIKVDERGLTLRSGKVVCMHNKTISFSAITALRRSRYNPSDYEKSNRPVDSFGKAQVWKMGGKEVLEIEAQDSRCLIILSSRAEQLASLLHEMTRVPIEDCR